MRQVYSIGKINQITICITSETKSEFRFELIKKNTLKRIFWVESKRSRHSSIKLQSTNLWFTKFQTKKKDLCQKKTKIFSASHFFIKIKWKKIKRKLFKRIKTINEINKDFKKMNYKNYILLQMHFFIILKNQWTKVHFKRCDQNQRRMITKKLTIVLSFWTRNFEFWMDHGGIEI